MSVNVWEGEGGAWGDESCGECGMWLTMAMQSLLTLICTFLCRERYSDHRSISKIA